MLDYRGRGEEMIQLMTKKKITFGKEERLAVLVSQIWLKITSSNSV